MATADLPEAAAHQLLVESMGNIQLSNAGARDSANAAMGLMRFVAVRNFDELGAVESKAVKGVLSAGV